jgi:hypothetical protein
MSFHWNLDKDFGKQESKKCERHDLRGCRGCPALHKVCKGGKAK